jgi:hypothetical protein
MQMLIANSSATSVLTDGSMHMRRMTGYFHVLHGMMHNVSK